MNILPGYITRSLLFAFCGIVFLAPLKAQDWRAWEPGYGHIETAFIYHAEGGDFAITLRSEQTVFTAEAARSETIILERSGIVHTGPGTFLVIRFAPSGAMVKMSEHTSLMYNGIDESGMFADIGLLYGRARVVSGETGNDGIRSVVVRCGGVSSRVIDGDMGVDYILEPALRGFPAVPLFRLDAFQGNAEVFSNGAGGTAAYFGGALSLTVHEGESLSLDLSSSVPFVERRSLRDDIIEYWNSRNFAHFPPIAMPEPADTAIAAAAEEPPVLPVPPAFEAVHETAPWEQPVISGNRNRGLLWLGLGLMAASVAVQGTAHHAPDAFPNGTASMAHGSAYGLFGVGALLSIMGILRNPSSSAP